MSIGNPDLKGVAYSAEYLRSLSDEANKWRSEFAEIMRKAHEHAHLGHYAMEWHTTLSETLQKELHRLGYKVHSNKKTITWQ